MVEHNQHIFDKPHWSRGRLGSTSSGILSVLFRYSISDAVCMHPESNRTRLPYMCRNRTCHGGRPTTKHSNSILIKRTAPEEAVQVATYAYIGWPVCGL